MSPTSGPGTTGPVTRSDLESKLREIRGTAEQATPEVPENAQRTGMIVAAGAAMVVVFLLGRRRGRKKNTIVEIHRI